MSAKIFKMFEKTIILLFFIHRITFNHQDISNNSEFIQAKVENILLRRELDDGEIGIKFVIKLISIMTNAWGFFLTMIYGGVLNKIYIFWILIESYDYLMTIVNLKTFLFFILIVLIMLRNILKVSIITWYINLVELFYFGKSRGVHTSEKSTRILKKNN
jgi:hypothetical protein